jgi:predicted amidohydrolase
MKVRVAAIQMNIKTGDKEVNIQRAAELIEKSADLGAESLCLPELFTTGYVLGSIRELAEEIPGPTTRELGRLASANGISIWGGSLPEGSDGRVYNTSVAMDQEGRVKGRYRKVHLFPPMGEDRVFSPGGRVVCTDVGGVRLGMMLCYDIRFPELSRRLTLEGAEVLVVPAEFPEPRLQHWRHLLTARAIENQVFVVAANRVGGDGRSSYFGHSMIIDPWGEVIAEGGREEDVILGEIDLDRIEVVRNSLPALQDRREDVY